MERIGRAPNRCVPCFNPPTTNAMPRTSRLLARIDPMSANWTTTTNPAWRLKSPMKSSGRLPRADCRIPVTAGPCRALSCPVPSPTSEASIASATAVAPKVITGVPPPATRTAETTVATMAAPSRKRVVRSKYPRIVNPATPLHASAAPAPSDRRSVPRPGRTRGSASRRPAHAARQGATSSGSNGLT